MAVNELFNVYCDESCHLEHDGISVMVLGAVWCKQYLARRISIHIRAIKIKHGLPATFEAKWSKVTKRRLEFYSDLITYFFDSDDLHFRGLLVPNKELLDHGAYQQSHNEWYFKMCFRLLSPIIRPTQIYRIYLDIKDTRSEKERATLERRLHGRRFSSDKEFLHRVQHIHSCESEIMQICDLLAGAIGFHNRKLAVNSGKAALAEQICQKSRCGLEGTTPRGESKFNLLTWEAKEVGVDPSE